MGQFYREHLQPVRLNRQDVNWTAQDLSYLQPDSYNAYVRQKLAGGHPAKYLLL
jgi:GNT-I family